MSPARKARTMQCYGRPLVDEWQFRAELAMLCRYSVRPSSTSTHACTTPLACPLWRQLLKVLPGICQEVCRGFFPAMLSIPLLFGLFGPAASIVPSQQIVSGKACKESAAPQQIGEFFYALDCMSGLKKNLTWVLCTSGHQHE